MGGSNSFKRLFASPHSSGVRGVSCAYFINSSGHGIMVTFMDIPPNLIFIERFL